MTTRNPWAPGWYGFDPDSEMCEAWGPNGSEADARVHPSLGVHPSEHGEIQTFLILDAAQARQLAGAPDQKLRAMLEGVDPPGTLYFDDRTQYQQAGPEPGAAIIAHALHALGRAPEAGHGSYIRAVAEGALDAAKLERMALEGPGPASGVEFTFTPIELGACESSPRPATFRRGAQAYCRHLTRVIPDDMRDVPIYCAAWLAGYDHAAATGLAREPLQPIDKDTLTYIRSRVAAFATIDATDARELLAAYDLLT